MMKATKQPSVGHPNGATDQAKPKRRTDPVVDAAIGRQLRQLFNDVASEPVPDRFAQLLKQLEDREGGKDKA